MNSDHERQDYVDNAVHSVLCWLASKDLPWDIELIGDIRDSIEMAFETRGIMKPEDFYPTPKEEENEKQND